MEEIGNVGMEPSIPNISLSFIKSIAFVHLQSVE